MGVVYEAEQGSLGRRVALKVLPAACPGRPGAGSTVRARGAGRGPAAPHQHRARLRRRPRGRHSLLRDAVHPGPAADEVLDRAAAAAPGGRSGSGARHGRTGCGRPDGGRRRPRTSPTRSGTDAFAPAVAGDLGSTDISRQPALEPERTEPHRAADGSRAAPGRDSNALVRSAAPAHSGWRYARTVARLGAAGGRGPRLRRPAGRAPPRRQAVQPPARRPRHALGHRLRPGQAVRLRRPDPHRRHPGHPPLHGPRAVPRPVRRPLGRLRAGPDPLRAPGPAAGVRGDRPVPPDRHGDAGRAAPPAQARPGHPARPGDDRAQGDRPRPVRPLPDGRRPGSRPDAIPGRPSDPGSAAQPPRRGLAMGQAKQDGGEPARLGELCWWWLCRPVR